MQRHRHPSSVVHADHAALRLSGKQQDQMRFPLKQTRSEQGGRASRDVLVDS